MMTALTKIEMPITPENSEPQWENPHWSLETDKELGSGALVLCGVENPPESSVYASLFNLRADRFIGLIEPNTGIYDGKQYGTIFPKNWRKPLPGMPKEVLLPAHDHTIFVVAEYKPGGVAENLLSQGVKKFTNEVSAVTIAESFESLSESEDIQDNQIRAEFKGGRINQITFNGVGGRDQENYGADTLRLYEMFLGPLEQSKPWDTNGIDGVHRFLKRLWGLFFKDDTLNISNEVPTSEELKILHKTIKKIGSDIEKFSFNTSVSSFMIAVNEFQKL